MYNSPRARKRRKLSHNDHVDSEKPSNQRVMHAIAEGQLNSPLKRGFLGFVGNVPLSRSPAADVEEEPELIFPHTVSDSPRCGTRPISDDIYQAAANTEFGTRHSNVASPHQMTRLVGGQLRGNQDGEDIDGALSDGEARCSHTIEKRVRHAIGTGKGTPKGHYRCATKDQERELRDDGPRTRSSTRQRRQPRRYALEVEPLLTSPSSRKARQSQGTARTVPPISTKSFSSDDQARGITSANGSGSVTTMILNGVQDISVGVVSGPLHEATSVRGKKALSKQMKHSINQVLGKRSGNAGISSQCRRLPNLNDGIEDEILDNSNFMLIGENQLEDSPTHRIPNGERSNSRNYRGRQPQSAGQITTLDVGYRYNHVSSPSTNAASPFGEDLFEDDELDLLSSADIVVPSTKSKQVETSAGLGDFAHHFELLKKIILEKLTGRRPIPLTGVDDEYDKVHHLLEQTVTAGEGNSMLIIGARGTGKTALVNAVLADIASKHREHFHVVRLNGFVQTDDKLALREIWRQLGREMEVDDQGQSMNYADTLTTLLALLSHPSELLGAETDQVAKSVIFIMDEFDLFAAHPRQTLLYNFFDIAQSRKAPIAVVGLTTRVDVAESLEKRVKSRFSHRYIHLGLPKNFVAFQHICKTALQVKPEELDFHERAQLCNPAGTAKRKCKSTGDADCISAWNASIEILFKSAPLIHHLSSIYHTSKSIPTFLTTFLVPVALLTPTSRHLTPSSITSETALQPPDSKLHLLPCLPTVALALLIAAARLDVILDIDTCNFDMAYEEYSGLVAKAKISASTGGGGGGGGVGVGVGITGRVWGKEVARGMWEKLVDLELLLPVVGGGGVSGVRRGEMVRCDVALEEVEGAMEGNLERGLQKWCREI